MEYPPTHFFNKWMGRCHSELLRTHTEAGKCPAFPPMVGFLKGGDLISFRVMNIDLATQKVPPLCLFFKLSHGVWCL